MGTPKVAILVARSPEHLELAVDRWLALHPVHVRSIAYTATRSSREALILYAGTPEPSTAAGAWIGEQLAPEPARREA